MRFGIHLPNFGPLGDARRVATWAREAEEAGWDGFFLWDHVARPGDADVVDPWIALAAAAALTDRVRLGALVTPIPRRRPWKLARETVSLDRLSGGRLVVGVGIGGGPGRRLEFDALGETADARTRGDQLDEGLAVLAGLWSGEPFAFHGRHFSLSQACFRPVPLQRPRIPVWVACGERTRRPLRRAARWDGIFPLLTALPAERRTAAFAACVAHVRALRREAGREADPFDAVHLGESPADDPRRAARIAASARQAGATWWLERMAPARFGARQDGSGPWCEEDVLARIRSGPPRDAHAGPSSEGASLR